MPAAAVIPAPIAYIKVVAVKKLVVGFLVRRRSAFVCVLVRLGILLENVLAFIAWRDLRSFTLRKLECSKQAMP